MPGLNLVVQLYDADLYVGVEGYKLSGTKNSGRETVIWRIEFASDSSPSKGAPGLGDSG